MFHRIREQVIAEFADCAKPSGCVKAPTRKRPLTLFGPIRTSRGNAVISREIGSNVRRIVEFPGKRKPSRPAA